MSTTTTVETVLHPLVVTPLRCRYPREVVEHPSWYVREIGLLGLEPLTPSVVGRASKLHEVRMGQLARLVDA